MNGAKSKRYLNQIGARLAIFAILLQLVLSFGHVHAFVETAPSVTQAVTDQSGSSDEGQAAGGCAICATIAAFGTLDLPQSIVAIRTVVTAETFALPASELAAPAASVTHFRSRAPPTA